MQPGASRKTEKPSHHTCSELRILQHSDQDTRARDYKEISSMSRCSTHDYVLPFNPKIENSEVVTINKLESVFCAQFEFRTQTEVNKSQIQRIGDYKHF